MSILSIHTLRAEVTTRTLGYARLLLLLVAALLATTTRALAENREGAFTISPFWGGQMSIFVGEDHLDGDHKWGGRLGYNFTPHLGTEFVFGENKTCHDPGNSPGTLRQYGADMLYFFRPEKKFVPFVAAGFGAFKVDFDNLPDRNTGYFNFGGGVEYSLLSWLGLRADVRDSVAFDRGDNLFEATIGIRLQFGHR